MINDDNEYIDASLDDYDIQLIEDKPKLTGLSVDITHNCTHYQRDDEEYTSWQSSYNNYFEATWITEDNPDIVTSLPIKTGDKVYLVWIEWSTGDSFGTAEYESYEPIGVFYDINAAQELEAFLEDSEDYSNLSSWGSVDKKQAEENIRKLKVDHNTTFEFIKSENSASKLGSVHTTLHTSDGQRFKFTYFNWCGYFDKLESIHIEETYIARLH